MYFVIQNGVIEVTNEENWHLCKNAISVHTVQEWQESELKVRYQLTQSQEDIHFCKLENRSEYLFGTLRIPVKKNAPKSEGFKFYILEGRIIFVDDSNIVSNGIKKIMECKKRKEYSMEQFLYDFLVELIEDDLLYLETIERKIAKLEESVLSGVLEGFNAVMLGTKKEIARLYRYYSQLTEVGEVLSENEMEFFGSESRTIFKVFTDRAARLQSEVQILREYSMQVQDVYRSEINIKQNSVMQVLTIVTTIFLPLTLIAGWYGMNFVYMPELGWKYGYLTVIVLSIIVVIGSIWIFKKKKFW